MIMDLKHLIEQRFSVRNFKNVAVPKEKIIQILEMARLAPSSVNYQPWHFIVITRKAKLEALAKCYPRPWFLTAPLVIVACVNRKEAWHRVKDNKDYGDVDIAIAVDHLTLAATSLGLGTCWVCNFDAEMCSETLELPSHLEPLVLVPMGFAIPEPPEKKRKKLDEIVSWEKYYPYT
jgi:nitroreductase